MVSRSVVFSSSPCLSWCVDYFNQRIDMLTYSHSEFSSRPENEMNMGTVPYRRIAVHLEYVISLIEGGKLLRIVLIDS